MRWDVLEVYDTWTPMCMESRTEIDISIIALLSVFPAVALAEFLFFLMPVGV